MKVKSIKQRRGSRARLVLRLEDETELELPAVVVLAAGVRPGSTLDAAMLAELERAAVAWRCKEAALKLLAHRPRSERELRQRLAMRTYPSEAVDATIASLQGSGLLDDEAFAAAFARDRIRSRPSGRRRLDAEIRAKGIGPEQARRAVDDAIETTGGGEPELAREAAAKFRLKATADPIAERRRLYGFLARRGFDSETIAQVAEEFIPLGRD